MKKTPPYFINVCGSRLFRHKSIWAAKRIPVADEAVLTKELKLAPELFKPYIPKTIADDLLKAEKDACFKTEKTQKKLTSSDVIPPQEISSCIRDDSLAELGHPLASKRTKRSTRISDAINDMFYKFLSSPDALQGEACLNSVQVTGISLDSHLQKCVLNIHIDDSKGHANTSNTQILSVLLRNEKRFRRYLSQHMKFRAVPAIEFIFEKSALENSKLI